MTAIVSPTLIPGSTPSSTPLRIALAPLGSSPMAVRSAAEADHRGLGEPPAAPGAVLFGGQVQPTAVTALWLMAAGRDCLRTSHVHRLMAEAALLRTMSETDPAVQAAWYSEEGHEVRDPAARPRIPAVSAPPTAR
ncbi:hypothetical protein ACFYXS_35750 [Streptomyces sp. NPDC002574]|uniref:hypothetical protein n=1 Tax=Streptomyces sp. NPDC002574 TaxID=3364652 RepID=UPI0036749202